ncbi:hypothetical protein J4234_03335 [Candidatus Woesearchaeota archaeon]|nr:hypothetical protein [Candidatus Woesearchaeota archaeon]
MNEHDHRQKEGFFQKIKHNHFFMVLTCVAPIVLLLVGSYFFGWKNNSLLLSVFLAACMFGHMFMMQNHKDH